MNIINLWIMYCLWSSPPLPSKIFSIKFKLSTNRAYFIMCACFAISLFLPYSSSRAWNAFYSMSSNKSLWTIMALRVKVVVLIFQEELICSTVFTLPIWQNWANWAWHTITTQEFLIVVALDFWYRHNDLALLIISKCTSNKNWILIWF